MIFHAFCPLWDYLLRFDALWPLPQTRLFPNGRGFGVSWREGDAKVFMMRE